MIDPRQVERDMLIGVVDLVVVKDGLDFSSAKQMAGRLAQKTLIDPLLLAWFDRKAWKHSPALC